VTGTPPPIPDAATFVDAVEAPLVDVLQWIIQEHGLEFVARYPKTVVRTLVGNTLPDLVAALGAAPSPPADLAATLRDLAAARRDQAIQALGHLEAEAHRAAGRILDNAAALVGEATVAPAPAPAECLCGDYGDGGPVPCCPIHGEAALGAAPPPPADHTGCFDQRYAKDIQREAFERGVAAERERIRQWWYEHVKTCGFDHGTCEDIAALLDDATAAPAPARITCACGHVIVNDSTCRCPGSCPTCFREDCCAEAWDIHGRKTAAPAPASHQHFTREGPVDCREADCEVAAPAPASEATP
jgi:hypothetical protein